MSDDRSSALRRITPPEDEPLTLAQAKAFLRIEHAADDNVLILAIAAARVAAEAHLRQALLPQTLEYCVANPRGRCLVLPTGPAQSIASVSFTNAAGESSTVDAANYRLSVDGLAVYFTNVPNIERLTVTYEAAAYTAVAEIPAPILQGMLHHVAAMVESRDGAAPLPVQAIHCYAPFRRVVL